MTDSISKNWESIFEDFKDSVSVKINQIFLKLDVKLELIYLGESKSAEKARR